MPGWTVTVPTQPVLPLGVVWPHSDHGPPLTLPSLLRVAYAELSDGGICGRSIQLRALGANRCGQGEAAGAVGATARANPLPVFIPCSAHHLRPGRTRSADTPISSARSAFCTFAALSQVYRPDCLAVPAAAGIYRGYMATLYSFGPFSAFYFGFYEQSKSVAVRLPPFPLVC